MTTGTRSRTRLPATVILDAAERLTILALYAWLIARIAHSMASGGRIANMLLLVSEGLVIVFLIARRTTSAVSRNPADWLLAIFASVGFQLLFPGARVGGVCVLLRAAELGRGLHEGKLASPGVNLTL